MAHKITVIGTIRLNDLQILQITGIQNKLRGGKLDIVEVDNIQPHSKVKLRSVNDLIIQDE